MAIKITLSRIWGDKVKYDIDKDLSQTIEFDEGFLSVKTIRFSTTKYSPVPFPSHWHFAFEAVVLLSGEIDYIVNGQHYKLMPGEGILINSNALHSSVCSETCESKILFFSPQIFRENHYIYHKYIERVTGSALAAVLIDGSQKWHHQLKDSIEQAFDACSLAEDGYELEVLRCLYTALQTLTKTLPLQPDMGRAIKQEHINTVKHMIDYIQNHYTDKIGVDDIAGAGAVCRSTCNNLFREILGQTPIEYLMCFRVEKGSEMLARGATVTESAMACGFNSVSYFSEVFKRIRGITPQKAKH